MVIETSALVAIFFDEPERRPFNEAIEAASRRLVSAAALVEAEIVLYARHGIAGSRVLDEFLRSARISIASVDEEQANAARIAFRRFGKGRHPAALNFGDCFSYALSKVTGEPLLYKGEDFAQTDIAAVSLAPD